MDKLRESKFDPRRSGRRCSIRTCLRSYRKSAKCEVRLFKFPKKEKYRRLWMLYLNLDPNTYVSENAFLCNYHFEEKYIGKKYLRGDAVPTLCLPGEVNPNNFDGEGMLTAEAAQRKQKTYHRKKHLLPVTCMPPLSVNSKDILNYCNQQENSNQAPVPMALALIEPEQHILSDFAIDTPPVNDIKVELIDVQEEELQVDIKPSIVELVQPVDDYVNTIDTLNYCDPQENSNQTPVPMELALIEPEQHILSDFANDSQAVNDIKVELNDVKDQEEEQVDIKPNIAELVPPVDDYESSTPKIPMSKSMCDNNKSDAPLSAGHWPQHSDKNYSLLPKKVKNYGDALKLLKPLEEFALLEENYRVIGLISALEEIFRNPPKKDDYEFHWV